MTMPVWDWQFVVVTIIAASAFLVLARQFLPARSGGTKGDGASALSKPGCAHCASNADAKPPATPSRTVMTQVVSLRDLRDTAHQTKH